MPVAAAPGGVGPGLPFTLPGPLLALLQRNAPDPDGAEGEAPVEAMAGGVMGALPKTGA